MNVYLRNKIHIIKTSWRNLGSIPLLLRIYWSILWILLLLRREALLQLLCKLMLLMHGILARSRPPMPDPTTRRHGDAAGLLSGKKWIFCSRMKRIKKNINIQIKLLVEPIRLLILHFYCLVLLWQNIATRPWAGWAGAWPPPSDSGWRTWRGGREGAGSPGRQGAEVEAAQPSGLRPHVLSACLASRGRGWVPRWLSHSWIFSRTWEERLARSLTSKQ